MAACTGKGILVSAFSQLQIHPLRPQSSGLDNEVVDGNMRLVGVDKKTTDLDKELVDEESGGLVDVDKKFLGLDKNRTGLGQE